MKVIEITSINEEDTYLLPIEHIEMVRYNYKKGVYDETLRRKVNEWELMILYSNGFSTVITFGKKEDLLKVYNRLRDELILLGGKNG